MNIQDCPFCLPVEEAQTVILQNELCYFVQQPQTVLVGSGLIVPKQHRETIFAVTGEEWAATYALLKEVKELIDKAWQPQGYNLGWNCGSVAGQEVFHAHMHVIPRFADEPLAGKGMRYWLKQENNRRDIKGQN